MKKKLLKGMVGIGALLMTFSMASCGLSDLTGLLPTDTTEEDDPSPTTTNGSSDSTTTTVKVESESKIEKLAKEKGYECEFRYLADDLGTIRFGCKGKTFWYENLDEATGVLIDVKDNGDTLYYQKEERNWKYQGYFESQNPDLSGFNMYQFLLTEPNITDEFKKGASQTVAGRKCDVYTVSVNYLTVVASVTYSIDQEYGVLLKMETSGSSIDGISQAFTFEATKFVVSPSLPNYTEPKDYKVFNPETGEDWDLFKTFGFEEFVPEGYTKISSVFSVEYEDDYSYVFEFDDLSKNQVKEKVSALASSFDTLLKAKASDGKIYEKYEWSKDELVEIESFALGNYDADEPNEADAAILISDDLYWVTLSYVDYYGDGILVQIRKYSYED